MTDKLLLVKDAVGDIQNIRTRDEGAGGLVSYHADADRQALLTAIALISTALGGTVNIAANALPLPNGAATQTTLANVLTALQGTLAISAASLPLPAGAATQTTLNNLLTRVNASPVGTSADPTSVYTPGGLLTVVGTVTRPADTNVYAVGDLIANSTTAGSVVPIELPNAARVVSEAVRIERIRLRKTGVSLTNASFRIHLFRTSPTVTVGDNGVFDNSNVYALSDIAGYIGPVDVTLDKAAVIGARGVGVPSIGSGITCEVANTTSIYALIEARGAYTPVSGEVFTITVEGARS